jgi:hypothetical protein
MRRRSNKLDRAEREPGAALRHQTSGPILYGLQKSIACERVVTVWREHYKPEPQLRIYCIGELRRCRRTARAVAFSQRVLGVQLLFHATPGAPVLQFHLQSIL